MTTLGPRLLAWTSPVWLLVWLLAWPSPARAHEFRPAVLDLQASADGEVLVRFVVPAMTAEGPPSSRLRPVPPSHCRVADPQRAAVRWSCGPAGLTGTLAIDPRGLVESPVDVLVSVRWPDGHTLQTRLGPDRPSVSLARGPAVAGATGVMGTYFALGGEHILLGLDHLLFVLALLLLGGRARDHLRTITAFTVGHSLSLLVQSLAPLPVPGAWVEACITASIVVAAAEVLQLPSSTPQRSSVGAGAGPESATAQARATAWTWALGFGLLHGLGFAGALAELGLPPDHVLTALLGFNLGVEAGQLAVVLALLSLAAAWPRRPSLRARLRRALALVVGSIAVAWTLDRVVAFWSLP